MFSFPTFSRTARLTSIILLLCSASPTLSFSQSEPPRRELTERVSTALQKLSEFMEAKNYDGALAMINPLIPTAAANSFDLALLSQIKAQVLLMKSDFPAAIPPLETAYNLGRTYNFFEPRQLNELSYYLAQLYYQEGSAAKDINLQRATLEKASTFISDYLANSEKPNPDAPVFAASLLYTRATLDPENVDEALLQEAMNLAREGLYAELEPKDNLYVLILAALQQFGRNEDAAEILEFLVKRNPTNRQYWGQLAATYLALGADEKVVDPSQIRQWNIRTIVTIERAQAVGIMTEPKDNFNLVGLYFNIERFDDAIRLLEDGLKNDRIENTQRNWELLASSYQQVNKELRAIETLKQAAKLYPSAGSLEFQIANIYYAIDNLREAYTHGLIALEKGSLNNTAQTNMFVAYLAYELQDYEVALVQAEAAAAAENDPNSSANRLLGAIRDAIREREATRRASAPL